MEQHPSGIGTSKATNQKWKSNKLRARRRVFFQILIGAAVAAIGSSDLQAQQVLWSSSGGSAWLTGTNWTGSAVPTASQIAQIGVNPTGSSGVGINFGNTTNAGTQTNGSRIQEVGAIELTSARTSGNPVVGNSSGTTGATGSLRLNGTTLNSISNVILRSNSSQNLTIQNTQGSGNQTMALLLGNATDNKIVVDSTGNIVISSLISSNSGTTPLTIQGSGTGRVDITNTANTFTGPIIINGGEVRFTANSSLGNAANSVTVDGGRLGIANVANTTIDLSSRNIFLGQTVGTSISAPGQVTTVLQYDGVLQDKLGSTGILVKQGAGALALGGVSTYTGATAINNGILQLTTGNDRLPTGTVVSLGQAGTVATTGGNNIGTLNLGGFNQTIAGLNSTTYVGTSTVFANKNTVTSSTAATLTIGGSGTYSYGAGTDANSGIITGAISVVKTGSGTQTFGDVNTYTGGTTVSQGTLIVTRSIASSSSISVAEAAALTSSGALNATTGTSTINGTTSGSGVFTVGTGAILAGAGTIENALVINGVLAPGNSIGTLKATNGATWNGGGPAWKFELGAGNSSDLLNITGDFTKGVGSGFSFNFGGATDTGVFNLVNWTGTTLFNVGDFSYDAGSLGGGNTGSFNLGANALSFTVTAVPEPSSMTLVGIATLGGVVYRSRRRVSDKAVVA